MSHLRRCGLALALLLSGVVTLSLFGSAGQAVAGGPYFVYLPVISNEVLFGLQPGSPSYLANFLNIFGCNWFGIAGRAFGRDSNPVIGLTVHLEGGGINQDVVTGSGPGALGPGGYEIPISDQPIATTGVYFIQLRTSTGAPLSAQFMIPTYADCAKNLILVNFTATP